MEYKTLRAYGKAELAQLYSPGASWVSALRLLNKYLHAADGLLDALQAQATRVAHATSPAIRCG